MDEVMVCSGCGTTRTDEQLAALRRSNPALRSCCPERKMVAYVPKTDVALAGEVGMRAGIEAGASVSDDHAVSWGAGMGTPAKVIAAAIRALTPTLSDALAAMLAEAEERGAARRG